MKFNGYELKPSCVLIRTTVFQLESIFKSLISEKTDIPEMFLDDLEIYFDDETQAIAVNVDSQDAMSEKMYDKLSEAKYNIQEHFMIVDVLLGQLFKEENNTLSIHAHGVEDDEETIFIEIPLAVYDKWKAINEAGPATENFVLGTFEVTSGSVMISDPCYDVSTWCQGKVENVKKGTWVATCNKQEIEHWGNRVSSLTIMHTDMESGIAGTKFDMHELPFDIGVDSGQCGFFDMDVYKNPDSVPEAAKARMDEEEDDPWYEQCCNITLTRMSAGTVPGGVVSSSGFGDGSYTAYAMYEFNDPNNQIIGLEVVFISDEDLEDEEEDLEVADPNVDKEEEF